MTCTIEQAKALLTANGYKITAPRAAKPKDGFEPYCEDRARGKRDDRCDRIDFEFADGVLVKGQIIKAKGKYQIAAAARAAIDRHRYRQRPRRMNTEKALRHPIEGYTVPEITAITLHGVDAKFNVAEVNQKTEAYRDLPEYPFRRAA